MIEAETVLNGAPRTCPDCGVDVLTRLWGDSAVRTACNCGPAYTRESEYAKPDVIAEAVKAAKAGFAAAEDISDWPEALWSVLVAAGIAR